MRPPFVLVHLPGRLVRSQKRCLTQLAAVQTPELTEEQSPPVQPSFQAASHKCHTCGKPVKPVQTVNGEVEF